MYRSSTIVSPIVNETQSSFSQLALSMLALTALSLPPLSQNDQTELLLDSDAMNISNMNKDNFHIPSPNTSTSRQITHKFNNNKNNPNIAETLLLPSTSVAVVRTSLSSQQSSLSTLPSVIFSVIFSIY